MLWFTVVVSANEMGHVIIDQFLEGLGRQLNFVYSPV